jgi:hypothetical protein
MKDFLDAPIEYDALRRGYYYSEPNYRIPGSFAGAEDLRRLFRPKYGTQSSKGCGKTAVRIKNIALTQNRFTLPADYDYNKVLEWLLSHGGNAQPLEPEELIADWKWHIEVMAEMANE